MTTLFEITYDGGSEGTTIGSESGWDAGSISGTRVYEGAAAVTGAFGAKSTGQSTMRKTITAINKWRLRWYQAHPTVAPGTNTTVAVARSSSTQVAGVRVEAAGTYRLVNVLTATGSSSAGNTADQVDRLEWAVDGDAGTQTLYIFRGANRHGTVPDETLTGTYTNATADNIGVALFLLVTSYLIRQDEVKATDLPGTLIGSSQVSVTVNAEAATGAGAAGDATPALGVAAVEAVGVGTAPFDPSTNTLDLTLISDSPVDATGAAYDATVLLGLQAPTAAGTGAAGDPTVTTQGPTVTGSAESSGDAGDPIIALLLFSEAAEGSGAALDATVEIPSALYLFTSPTRTVYDHPFAGMGLGRGMRVERVIGLTVLRVDGEWRTAASGDAQVEAAADRLYYGGHVYTVSQTEADELIAAGYGPYVTPVPG